MLFSGRLGTLLPYYESISDEFCEQRPRSISAIKQKVRELWFKVALQASVGVNFERCGNEFFVFMRSASLPPSTCGVVKAQLYLRSPLYLAVSYVDKPVAPTISVLPCDEDISRLCFLASTTLSSLKVVSFILG